MAVILRAVMLRSAPPSVQPRFAFPHGRDPLSQSVAGFNRPAAAGFSLLEVLVAGLVIVIVAVASTRLITTSLANGQQTAQRQQLEAEIASDLDRVSQQDESLYLSVDAALTANPNVRPAACANPADSLKQQVDASPPAVSSSLWSRQTSTTGSGLLKVSYAVTMPGGQDTRVVEITPSFQGLCLQGSLGLK